VFPYSPHCAFSFRLGPGCITPFDRIRPLPLPLFLLSVGRWPRFWPVATFFSIFSKWAMAIVQSFLVALPVPLSFTWVMRGKLAARFRVHPAPPDPLTMFGCFPFLFHFSLAPWTFPYQAFRLACPFAPPEPPMAVRRGILAFVRHLFDLPPFSLLSLCYARGLCFPFFTSFSHLTPPPPDTYLSVSVVWFHSPC